MTRRLKVAINRRIINKIPKNDKKSFSILTREFENVEFTLPELAASINAGYPFCAQHTDIRKDANFICSDVLAVDIDSGMTLNEALDHPFVQQYAGFVYTTPSHTPEHHRFRMGFELGRTITDPSEMRAASQGIIRKFGGDQSCKDACRAFYGSKNSEPIILGNVLPNEQLAEIIALGRDAPSIADRTSTEGKTKYPIVTRRSGIEISPEHPVTADDGTTQAFQLVPVGKNIHCPVHLDRNPSAFVVQGKEGNKGAYCHTCAATFWMTSQRKSPDEFDFYKTEDIIHRLEYEQNPHHYYDLDEDPTSLFIQEDTERSAHTFSRRYLRTSDIPHSPGVTFIQSEKGSGKSEVLANMVAEFRQRGMSVLLAGHRQTLLQSMASRIGLLCYFYMLDGEFRNNQPTEYYAICVDSIFKLLNPARHKYDVVIIDESEQVFGHLTGSTLKDKRRACYIQLFHYLNVATSVIVADADLGPISIEGVYQAMGPNTPYQFYLNDYRQGKNEAHDFQHYSSEPHLTQDMLSAIGSGGRYYITTNSIAKANELQEAIRVVHGDGPKVILVTSETARTEEVQNFISNIKTEILNYHVVIASPTLGTGIDITFPDAAQRIDAVYGFFVTRVNTHFDIDQQLARVRHPKAVKVWIAPNTFTFETEPEVILKETIMNGVLNDMLIGYGRDGSPAMDQTYLNVYANVVSIARASKNNLRKNLLELRARNGWNLVHVDVEPQGAEIGKAVKKIAKDNVEEERIENICAAAVLSEDDYCMLQEMASPLSKEEDDAKQRYEIEKFYRENISAELVSLDSKGSYRRKLALLEVYLSPSQDLIEKDWREAELAIIVSDRKKRMLKQVMLKELLTRAGLADAATPIKEDVVVTSADLTKFAEFCSENSVRLQDLFGMSVRLDIRNKPMAQLGIVLNQIGLSMENCMKKKVNGETYYYYHIHPEELGSAMHYVRRRRERSVDRQQYLAVA